MHLYLIRSIGTPLSVSILVVDVFEDNTFFTFALSMGSLLVVEFLCCAYAGCTSNIKKAAAIKDGIK
jgi:hypothetical protein